MAAAGATMSKPNLTNNLANELSFRIVGQSSAISEIVPFIRLHEAGLSRQDRPAGIFLLLGPTGTGKTYTVEVLSEILHGDRKKLVRVDCAEYQLDHEVARLIGAPPGYLGHRETQAYFSQARINHAASDRCRLSIVLLDEIEKASPALFRLMLGVMDKGTLTLGDNTQVSFRDTLIFMTSNLGARNMLNALENRFGFSADRRVPKPEQMERIGMEAVKRKFSPEFVNRLDRVLTYRLLTREDMGRIIDLEIRRLEDHFYSRSYLVRFLVTDKAKDRLIEESFRPDRGARELRRVLERRLLHPAAEILLAQQKTEMLFVLNENLDLKLSSGE